MKTITLNGRTYRRSKRHNRAGGGLDEHAATELELFVENDERLHTQMEVPILKNLANKKANGKYDHEAAVRGFMYLMDAGAKKYATEFGSSPSEWHRIFTTETRRHVARRFVDAFEVEYSLGNYDNLLTKVALKRRSKTNDNNRARSAQPENGYAYVWEPETGAELRKGWERSRSDDWNHHVLSGSDFVGATYVGTKRIDYVPHRVWRLADGRLIAQVNRGAMR